MSKEKQIEEMANIICGGCAVDHKHRSFISKSKLCPAVLSDSETLYTAGYRKQSEGEWIAHEDDLCGNYYTCSACGCDWTTIDGTPWENNMRYCPECGANMKGGVQE